MTGELAPSEREIRISDLERERAIEQLRGAIAPGRFTLEEFEQRIGEVYQAQTRADLAPLVADVVPGYAVRESAELRVSSGSMKRNGRWAPPRRLVLEVGSGEIKLDFTEAVMPHPEVDISLTVKSGSVKIVMPPGGAAEVTDVEVRSGAVKSRVPALPEHGGLFIRVTGAVRSGSVKIRYQRRFWRWRW